MGRNLSELLSKSPTSAQQDLLQRIAGEASARRYPMYLVGGFVRDLLLGRPSLDFDLVLEGDAVVLAQALVEKYGGRVTAHTKFGTAKINIRDGRIGRNPPPDFNSPNPPPSPTYLISAPIETYNQYSALPNLKHAPL